MYGTYIIWFEFVLTYCIIIYIKQIMKKLSIWNLVDTNTYIIYFSFKKLKEYITFKKITQ